MTRVIQLITRFYLPSNVSHTCLYSPAGTHCAYPCMDGQAELTWVVGQTEINFSTGSWTPIQSPIPVLTETGVKQICRCQTTDSIGTLIKQLYETQPIIIYLWRFDLYQKCSIRTLFNSCSGSCHSRVVMWQEIGQTCGWVYVALVHVKFCSVFEHRVNQLACALCLYVWCTCRWIIRRLCWHLVAHDQSSSHMIEQWNSLNQCTLSHIMTTNKVTLCMHYLHISMCAAWVWSLVIISAVVPGTDTEKITWRHCAVNDSICAVKIEKLCSPKITKLEIFSFSFHYRLLLPVLPSPCICAVPNFP